MPEVPWPGRLGLPPAWLSPRPAFPTSPAPLRASKACRMQGARITGNRPCPRLTDSTSRGGRLRHDHSGTSAIGQARLSVHLAASRDNRPVRDQGRRHSVSNPGQGLAGIGPPRALEQSVRASSDPNAMPNHHAFCVDAPPRTEETRATEPHGHVPMPQLPCHASTSTRSRSPHATRSRICRPAGASDLGATPCRRSEPPACPQTTGGHASTPEATPG